MGKLSRDLIEEILNDDLEDSGKLVADDSPEKCNQCNKKGVWVYAPDSSHGAYCDEHVPRGCSCNDGAVDEFGREYPCVEYWKIDD